MKCLEHDVARIHYRESGKIETSIHKLSALFQKNPRLAEPFRGMNDTARELFSSAGFQLYPTVERTTLFYDNESDCFFKLIHPLGLKHRMLFMLTNMAAAVYRTSEYLILKGVHIQRLEAYGVLKKGRKPLFGMKKAAGTSLYETLIVKGHPISMNAALAALDECVKLHSLGYWFGDAHLSHFFLQDEKITGIIDIEGIRRNRPFALKRLAQDIAGVNHPRLPLSRDEMCALLDHYLIALRITKKEQFKEYVQYYSERRWRE